jgi:outer membrane lipoprotein LolB
MIFTSEVVLFFKKKLSAALCFLLISVLFQCQSIQNNHTQDFTVLNTRSDYKQFLEQYPVWHYKGRIGLTYPYQGKLKAVSANIDWQQNNNDFDIAISGPLGVGRITVKKRLGKTVLINNQGEKFVSSNPEHLVYQHTGMQLPWLELSWWVRALPSPDRSFTETFAETFTEESTESFTEGSTEAIPLIISETPSQESVSQLEQHQQIQQLQQLQQLQQSGWVIDYVSYDDFEQSTLPRKIKFSNGEIKGTLLVRSWELMRK